MAAASADDAPPPPPPPPAAAAAATSRTKPGRSSGIPSELRSDSTVTAASPAAADGASEASAAAGEAAEAAAEKAAGEAAAGAGGAGGSSKADAICRGRARIAGSSSRATTRPDLQRTRTQMQPLGAAHTDAVA